MKVKKILAFAIASSILLSFSFMSSELKGKHTKATESKTKSRDSHGGLIMEDPNIWD